MVAARAVFDIVRGQDDIGTTIGMLVSDSAGYVSFNLTPIWRSGRTTIPRLLIYCTAASEKPLDVTASLHLSGAQIDFVLHADPRASLPPSDRAKLPSIQEPDLQDWELSPRSFSLQRELVLGDGDCRIGAPPENVEQEFNFFRIVLEPEPGLLQSGQGRIDTLKDLTQLGRDDIIFGEVDEYRQRWYALGHSLGAIAYSLPLAPCESVDLTVIDWSRTDAGFRADAVTAVEDVDTI